MSLEEKLEDILQHSIKLQETMDKMMQDIYIPQIPQDLINHV